MQRVGFTLSRSDQQTVDNQPVVQDVRIAQQVFNRLTGLSFVQYANAHHSRSNAGHQNEDGIGLADKELYGWFTEAALKGLFGDAYEPIKTSLTFLYEMSGISDIGVIITIIGDLLAGKKFETEQAIDLGFATIGLTLTIVTVATGGAGGGLKVALKKPLDTLKALLKELFINPADVLKLVKGGGTIVKRTFVLLKGFVTGDPKAAKELADIVTGMTKSASDASGKTLKFMMAMAQSPKRFARFVRLIRTSKNAAAAGGCVIDSTAQLIKQRLLPLSIASAYASGDGCDLLGDVAALAARNGDDAIQIASDIAGVINRLDDAEIFLNSASRATLSRMVQSGHGETINNFFDKVIDGRVSYTQPIAPVTFVDYPLNQPARIINRDTGEYIEADGVLADYFMGAIDEILRHSDDVQPEYLLKALSETRSAGKVDMSKIKGLFGELEALKAVRNIEEYEGAVLKSVNNRALSTRGGDVPGIDAEYLLSDGRSMYVESKNLLSGNIKGLKEQLNKHVREAITKNHIVEGTRGIRWKDNKIPRLHFELRGSYFKVENGSDYVGIRNAFRSEIMASSESHMVMLRKLLEKDMGGFDAAFDKLIRIEIYPEVIPPFSG
jgi:hypothetical protein